MSWDERVDVVVASLLLLAITAGDLKSFADAISTARTRRRLRRRAARRLHSTAAQKRRDKHPTG